MVARDVVPTRSVLLELQEERRFTREGHEFLDQKRMLVAGELLRCLTRFEAAERRLLEARAAAVRALAEAVARHGVDELGAYPAGRFDLGAIELRVEKFLGVPGVERVGDASSEPPRTPVLVPSPEARRCRERFVRLLELELDLAVLAGNVTRLLDEYAKTERRTRALENVILPELSETVKHVEEKLEELDQEDAARMRRGSRY